MSAAVDAEGHHVQKPAALQLASIVAADVKAGASSAATHDQKWTHDIVMGAFVGSTAGIDAGLLLVKGVHSGRGAPRHLRAVLALVHHYREHPKMKPYYGTPAGHYPPSTSEGALVAWTRANIGLFCSAVVAHYGLAKGVHGLSPYNRPADFVGPANARKDWERVLSVEHGTGRKTYYPSSPVKVGYLRPVSAGLEV